MIASYIVEFAFMDVYYLKSDIDVNKLTLQDEEVESVKWLSIDEIKKLIEQDKLRKGNIKAFDSILSYLKSKN